MRLSGPPFNTWFTEPTRAPKPNGISIGSAVFAQLTAESPYTLQGAKIAHSHGDPHSAPPHLIHDGLSKRYLDQFSRLCRCHDRDWQTDRPTDHATRSVPIGRIYVRSTAMRPNNQLHICEPKIKSSSTRRSRYRQQAHVVSQ